jgi:copper transport protein
MKAAAARAVLLLLVLVAPGGAAAHAVLLDASPADGATLSAAPREIVLRFNEPVEPVFVRLLDGQGRTRAARASGSYDATVRLAAPADLESGGYVVSYRVVSADSHPVGGSVVFGIGVEPSVAPSGNEGVWNIAIVVHRFLFYATVLVAAGVTLFLVLVGGGPAAPRIRCVFWVAVGAGTVVTIAGVAVKGGQLGDWRLGLATSAATAAAIALVGLALIGTAQVVKHRGLALLGVAAIAASFAFSGHATVAEQRWPVALLAFVHVFAVSFWIGSLAPLLIVLRRAPEHAEDAVRRFSTIAMWLVAALLIAGLLMAMAHNLRSFRALVVEPYGQALLWKLAGFAALLALAAWNKWRLTRNRKWTGLARSIRIEIAVVCLVLAMTASLSQTAPPAAAGHQHAQQAPGVTIAVVTGNRTAIMSLNPAIAGRNALMVWFTGFQPKEVIAEWALPGAGIEPIRRPLTAGTPYTGEITLPIAGNWRVTLGALVSDFERVSFATAFTVGAGP